jgi:hypothetical protein
MKPLLAVLAVAAACASGALASVTVAPAKLVLRAAQVGPGYVLVPFQEGRTLKRPTLDMCHLTFRSEKLRLARDKVVFQRGQNDPTIANEVVTYKPGGAAQALKDIRGSIARCPKGPVKSGLATITTTIQVLHPKGTFLPGSIALAIHASGSVNKKPVSVDGTALYQVRGNVLSGVYAYGSSPDERLSTMLHAAEQSAAKLAG